MARVGQKLQAGDEGVGGSRKDVTQKTDREYTKEDLTDLSGIAGTFAGLTATSDYRDYEDSTQLVSSSFSGLSVGLSSAAMLGGPAGIALGVAAGAFDFFGSKKKAKRARAEAERQRRELWQQQLKQYKSQIRQTDKQVTQFTRKIEGQLFGGEARETLFATADKEAAMAVEYLNAQAGNVNVVGEDFEGREDQVDALIASTEESLDNQLSKLNKVHDLLELEINAGRSVGVIEKGFARQAEKLLTEIEAGDYKLS